ncbi:MAG TPA: hypothetical protein VH234_02590 [Candidatus Saccharimonadales bacterium]|jgi:hypothetical protein|nr:hypothetical protein [Candidatus Saccharimonadales bacterium]
MRKFYAALLVLLAIISAVVAVIYFTHTAGNLPHFFLGYTKDSAHKHTKHGLAFISLAVVLLLGAWMVSGQKEEPPRVEKSLLH